MKTKPILGLSCAGGGAHGAYQVGVLKYIHEHFCDGSHSPFQIFSGSSCGSLNTSFYAAESHDAHKARLHLEDLWLHFHVPQYHGNIFKNAFVTLFKEWRIKPRERQNAWALLDPKPMQAIIEKGFRREHLEKSLKLGTTKGVSISATEIISGRTCWFSEGPSAKEWNLFHSVGVRDKIMSDHLIASCSVPFFLPPVKLGNHYFVDGSVSLIKPLNPAITMGADRILSIATDKPSSQDLPQPRPDFKPRVSNVIRLLLNRLSHDAAGDESAEIEAFNRFYQGLSSKHRRHEKNWQEIPLFHQDAKPSHYHKTEIFRFIPSRKISLSGGGDDLNSAVPRRKTRFMFHKSFIRDLIDLGYSDAAARRHELEKFFHPKKKEKIWSFFGGRENAA